MSFKKTGPNTDHYLKPRYKSLIQKIVGVGSSKNAQQNAAAKLLKF